MTVTIIGILMALVGGAMRMAQNAGREARTRATIAKIHQVIMTRYEEYHTRRVPINPLAYAQDRPAWYPPTAQGTIAADQLARVRVNALRDLMRMEMPDRYTDLQTIGILSEPPALTRRYLRTIDRARQRLMNQQGLSEEQANNRIEQFGAAELLYMIVMSDPDAAEMFSPREIGDYDGDGLPEFHDGWGRPIRFLRWPAGFVGDDHADSDLHPRRRFPPYASGEPPDNDPFDPRNLIGSSAPFPLYPLIYSAGASGIYDINVGTQNGDAFTYQYQLNENGDLDPFRQDPNGLYVGQPADAAAIDGRPGQSEGMDVTNPRYLDHYDNIHNHRIEAR